MSEATALPTEPQPLQIFVEHLFAGKWRYRKNEKQAENGQFLWNLHERKIIVSVGF